MRASARLPCSHSRDSLSWCRPRCGRVFVQREPMLDCARTRTLLPIQLAHSMHISENKGHRVQLSCVGREHKYQQDLPTRAMKEPSRINWLILLSISDHSTSPLHLSEQTVFGAYILTAKDRPYDVMCRTVRYISRQCRHEWLILLNPCFFGRSLYNCPIFTEGSRARRGGVYIWLYSRYVPMSECPICGPQRGTYDFRSTIMVGRSSPEGGHRILTRDTPIRPLPGRRRMCIVM